jgi:hypothetical protein
MVRADLVQVGFSQRLTVTVSSTRPFTRRDHPRSVAVRYQRARFWLWPISRRASPRAGYRYSSTWQSPQGSSLEDLSGRWVTLMVRSAARTTSYRRIVRRPPTTFAPSSRNTKGEEAFRRIKQYFVNSRFTDCVQGWPGCATEHRYSHCSGGDLNGNWRYGSFPATAESTSGPYRVVDAYQTTGGSWGVTYQVTLPSGAIAAYSWLVVPHGAAQGVSAVGEESGQLRVYRWQQPAGC